VRPAARSARRLLGRAHGADPVRTASKLLRERRIRRLCAPERRHFHSSDNRLVAADNVLSDGTQYQMCTITANAATGGYDATLDVGIIA
jgi:hypothetical protein